MTPELQTLFAPNDFFWKKAVTGCAMSHLSLWWKLVNEHSDIQNYLQDQAVMYYASTAARTSAIASPTTGMVSYVGDTPPQIETYTGAAWQNLNGLTLLNASTFTTVTSVQIDNVFTTAYDNYRILFATTAVVTPGAFTYTLRTSAPADLAAASYAYVNTGFAASSPTTASSVGANAGTGTNAIVGYTNQAPNALQIDLFNVPIAQPTMVTGINLASSATDVNATSHASVYKVSTAAAGIRFNFNGNCTGTVKIYGYRNA
jgi:hypothetical protein